MLNLSRQKAALVLIITSACCYAVFMLLTVFFYEKTQLAKNTRNLVVLLNDSLSTDLNDGNYRKYLETLTNRKIDFGITEAVIIKNGLDNSLISSEASPEAFVCNGQEYEFLQQRLLVCLYPNKSISVQVAIQLEKYILFKNPLFLMVTFVNFIFAAVFILIFIAVIKIYLDGLLKYLTDISFEEEKVSFVVPEDFKIVSQPIMSLLDKIKSLNIQIEDQAKLNAIIDISKQVAHDIRSPLSALTIAVKNLNENSREKELIMNASSRIEKIANDLLQKARVDLLLSNDADYPVFDLNVIVDQIVQEKKIRFQNINIDLDLSESTRAYGDVVEVSRLLSNIIDNSIEALQYKPEGQISIFLRYFEDSAQLVILDDGPGISPDIIYKLGTKGFTVGKEFGSGLGLYHAKKYLLSINGQFSISSQLGRGTSVSLKFRTSSST